MSDRVAVMNGGSLVQLGPPRSLYDHPADAFVADFIGEMNLLPGTIEAVAGDGCTVRTVGGAAPGRFPGVPPGLGAAARLAVRPEHVQLSTAAGGAGLAGVVAHCVFNGANTAILVELADGTMLRADVGARSGVAGLAPGAAVTASWPEADAIVFPQAG